MNLMYNITSTETQPHSFNFFSNFNDEMIGVNFLSNKKTIIKFSSTNSVIKNIPDGYERDHLEILMKGNTSKVVIYYRPSNSAAGKLRRI